MFPVHFGIRIDQWQALHCILYSEQYILHRKEIQHTSNIASTRDIPYLPLRMGFQDLNMGMTHTMTDKDMTHLFVFDRGCFDNCIHNQWDTFSSFQNFNENLQLYTAPSGENILETLLRFDVPLVIVVIQHLNKIIEILFFGFTTSAQLSRTAHPSGIPWLVNKLWTNPYRHWATFLTEHQSYRTRHNRRNLRFLYIRHFPFLVVGKVENHLWWRHRVNWIGHLEYPWNLSNVHLKFKRVWPKVNCRQSERPSKWRVTQKWTVFSFSLSVGPPEDSK